MLHLIDSSTDPCHDFYDHVCGGFERSAQMTGDQVIPPSLPAQHYEGIHPVHTRGGLPTLCVAPGGRVIVPG